MASWTGVITNAGSALLAGWLDGSTLTFVSTASGSGSVNITTLRQQTAVSSQKQVGSLVLLEKTESGSRKIKLQYAVPQTGYTMRQIGIFAKLDNGQSVLLALFQHSEGIAIPSSAEQPEFVYSFYATLALGNDGDAEIVIDTSASVSMSTFLSAMAGKQDKITATGLLKGTANGVVEAVPGEDYAPPQLTGTGAPTTETAGLEGQRYIDSTSGNEYICEGQIDEEYIWSLLELAAAKLQQSVNIGGAEFDGSGSITLEQIGAASASALSALTEVVSHKAVTNTYTVVIPTTGWTATEGSAPYHKTINVSGILASDNPIAGLVAPTSYADVEAAQLAFAEIYRIATAAGSITLYAHSAPSTAITIQLKVVR